MTTYEDAMIDRYYAPMHAEVDADRAAQDREPDPETDPLYGMGILDVFSAIEEDAREENLYWENERQLLADARYDEYWRG